MFALINSFVFFSNSSVFKSSNEFFISSIKLATLSNTSATALAASTPFSTFSNFSFVSSLNLFSIFSITPVEPTISFNIFTGTFISALSFICVLRTLGSLSGFLPFALVSPVVIAFPRILKLSFRSFIKFLKTSSSSCCDIANNPNLSFKYSSEFAKDEN